ELRARLLLRHVDIGACRPARPVDDRGDRRSRGRLPVRRAAHHRIGLKGDRTMRIALRMLAAAATVLAAGSAAATERTVTLAVDNMTCETCPPIVRRTL